MTFLDKQSSASNPYPKPPRLPLNTLPRWREHILKDLAHPGSARNMFSKLRMDVWNQLVSPIMTNLMTITISIEASSICLIYSHTFLCSQLFFRAQSQEVLRHGEVEGLKVRLDRLGRGRFGWMSNSFPSLHRPDNAIRASPLSDKPTAWALLLGCGS